MSEALSCSPTLAARARLADLAQANYKTAKSNLYPQLLLQLSQNEITGARAAIVLRAQSGNGLSKFSRIDAAQSRIARAIAEQGQADRQLRDQVRREFIALRSNQKRAEIGRQAVQGAASLLASYRRLFIAGRRSWLDVMNALGEAYRTRLSQRDARVLAESSAARILALSCRWRPGKGQEG